MNTAKAILQISLVFLAVVGCADRDTKRESPSVHINISPQKVQLEIIDSLIRCGDHRKALVLLDSFQSIHDDEICLIQSEFLRDEALDSLYRK